MIIEMEVRKLRPGMYVIIPGSWFGHDFVKGDFKLEHQRDIDKIIACGIRMLKVDLARSNPEALNPPEDPGPQKEPPSSGTSTPVPDNLAASLKATHLPPEAQAREIRDSALQLMQNLLASPTAHNIREAKQAIYQITNHIITNNDTTHYLIRLTSHDYYTYTHSVNVGILSIALAKEIYQRQVKFHNLQEMGAGFFLHDLGKVNIDSAIINKNGPLTDGEMKTMRTHPVLGFSLLSRAKLLTNECKHIVWQHHERHDGTGYPQGLAGDDIHEYAKICALADVYDALTTRRSYKEPLSPFAALDLMKRQMLPHFQKNLFDRLVLLLA